MTTLLEAAIEALQNLEVGRDYEPGNARVILRDAIAVEQAKQERNCATCRYEQQNSELAPCLTCVDAYAYPSFADAHETEHNWEPKP